MTQKTKKLINAPEDIIPEMIEGMLATWPDLLTLEGGTGRAIVARDGPRDGKVGVVIGGGSGHEPAFAGYVGRGLADAAALGNIFASPSPAQILDACHAADGGAGVVMLYGNYTGDVLNFSMAAEDLEVRGIPARQIAVTDDIASAPKGREAERRGIAGDFFIFKCAGAAAERGDPLERVVELTRHANAMCRSMGVALGACSLPQTGTLNFEISDDEMEIGMGLHGEPGVRRSALASADTVTGILLEPILEELTLSDGDSVAVLVNGLGSTTQIELLLLFRRLKTILDQRGISLHRQWVGEYATSLEMAGASITLLKLDAELTALLDHPCHAPALTVGLAAPGRSTQRRHRSTHHAIQAARPALGDLANGGAVTPKLFRAMMRAVAETIRANRDWLSQLDGAIGDGDHGVTMDIGWAAVAASLQEVEPDEPIFATCERMATAFLDSVGASSGPLYASALRTAGKRVADRADLDPTSLAAWIAGMYEGILARGGARPGDKTMLDAWSPAAKAARNAARQSIPGQATECMVLQAAASAAEAGAEATAALESRRGRAARLGTRSLGHKDPGAVSAGLMLRAMSDWLTAQTPPV